MNGPSRRSARGRIKSSSTGTDERGDSLRHSPIIRPGKRKELASIGAFKRNLKILVGLMILGIFVIYFVINRMFSHGLFDEPRVITPFPAPKLMDLSMVHESYYRMLLFFSLSLLFLWEIWIGRFVLFMCFSSKASTRRACTGELIVLIFILVFARGMHSHCEWRRLSTSGNWNCLCCLSLFRLT